MLDYENLRFDHVRLIKMDSTETYEFERELEAELSLLDEEYFGNRDEVEEIDIDAQSNNEGDSESESDEDIVPVELRELDLEEEKIIKEFKSLSCGCNKKGGLPCSDYFSEEELSKLRMSMAELEKDQLDMVILSQISAHHYSGEIVGHRTEAELQNRGSRAKDYTVFFYQSKSICLKTFLFIHYIGKKRFRNLLKHYQVNGVVPRRHGNIKRKPWHAARLCEKEHVIDFVKNIAEAHALPLPGRLPKFYDYNIMLLPTHFTKASVYREYTEATEAASIRCFGYREFCRLWAEVIPYIRVLPPADDLCHVCPENTTLILKSANLSEDEKTERLLAAQHHLECAKVQRNYYRKCVKSSRANVVDSQELPALTLSYSFDHAQQIHYPNSPQQPGPLYFKTPRKCGIFGVCDEGNITQVSYLIDEAQSCGKGANTIISMVHHYLENYTHGEESIALHADNCVGQNKNNAMVWYLAWRVKVGLNKSCELNFMLVGHTRFSPDRFFGLIKRKYRRTRVSSLKEIVEVVESSTTCLKNLVYVIGEENSSMPFQYYDWATFLGNYFIQIPQITSYQHFRVSKDHPYTVFVRHFANKEETTISILKENINISMALPSILQPSGLSFERQQYLFEHIRPFCEEKYRDITCPDPTRGQGKKRPQPQTTETSVKKAKHLCSYCRNPGHTKTKKGQISCPQLLKTKKH